MKPSFDQTTPGIRIRGAHQNNLRGIDLDLPLGELVVVTGRSGSGKSSLAFDTLYAEGQRRYVETFSSYARQFLDRMDRPRVDRIDGVLPAIAIGHANNVRTSRSTVGTMTELSDLMKLLYARIGRLHCRGCGRPVERDDAGRIWKKLLATRRDAAAVIAFPVRFPEAVDPGEVASTLLTHGFRRLIHGGETRRLDVDPAPGRPADGTWWVVADRIRIETGRRARAVEGLETGLKWGKGTVRAVVNGGESDLFSAHLHCPHCDIEYDDPTPNLFSFNNPLGACSACRGFGRIIEIDPDLVVPDPRLSLDAGAIRPWTTKTGSQCMPELRQFCRRRGIPMDVPFADLPEESQRLVFTGDDGFYGVDGFFRWLESRVYRMHVRVLLSRYRAYRTCPACRGTRLRDDALLYQVAGRTLPEIYSTPVTQAEALFAAMPVPPGRADPLGMLLRRIRDRLRYLEEAGLGYLTLDRPSRTLSGGEMERVHLTAALGNALVNTLYVLDEPTVGLHPRDVDRMTRILERLRDLGNTVVVVEHDPAVIRRADTIIDLGPGPGEEGGRIVYQGPAAGITRARESVTGDYLAGRRTMPATPHRRPARADQALRVIGAREHNLREIDVDIPLGILVCVTGVSGSGKSTLVHDVIYKNLLRAAGRPVSEVGACRRIEGGNEIDEVVLVDQQPLGKSARSNPATYIGAWKAIRERFAASADARRQGFGPGDFSFNGGNGRCERCGGTGFERIEMQFLSDVYLRCPSCEGRRFRDEILAVRDRDRSVADVLEMTISTAAGLYEDDPSIADPLRVMERVGLGYLRLGQPVTTLSGGEAQRLKLARRLAAARLGPGGGALLLLDEPTTGLHFEDVRILVESLHALVDAGQSVVVIEHNLDLIAQADHVIDLGPEGGSEGGDVMAVGTPEQVARARGSHTGRALARAAAAGGARGRKRPRRAIGQGSAGARAPQIRVTGAREHNLQSVDVALPRDRLTVVTGVSGSGKSSLAFDVLYGEGQRRYLDTLSAYVRQYVGQLSPADVDRVDGIPPTVAIEQRISRGGRKSTVATVTEIHNYLRLLFARLGIAHCPDCGHEIRERSFDEVVRAVRRDYGGRRVRVTARLVHARKGFHRELADWARTRRIERLRVDGRWAATSAFPELNRYQEHTVDAEIGRVTPQARGADPNLRRVCRTALEAGNGVFAVTRGERGPETVYGTRRACPECGTAFPEPDPRLFSFHSPVGWCPECRGLGVIVDDDAHSAGERVCGGCDGRRLRPEALAVRFRDRSIDQWMRLAVDDLARVFAGIRLRGREDAIGRDIVTELRGRLRFLQRVGLGYLGLDRRADTLSGGEAQRIRLAAQLGSNLRGVCYILDEPTIGLHPHDNARLIDTLRELRSRGNTVVVVEHDSEVIRSADHVIDLGPGPGRDGGRVVAAGPPDRIAAVARSITGQWLARPTAPVEARHRPTRGAEWVEVRGARAHNLRGIDARIPLGRLTVVCGISGSGKSSLIHDVLIAGLTALRAGDPAPDGLCNAIEGADAVRRVCEVDQSPIGKTPRSVPATYIKVWDEVRRVFAATPEARVRGYGPARFSFNSKAGRCPVCDGQGTVRIEMSFLPDTRVACEGCGGRRYADAVLEVEYRERNIADILEMTVDEAREFFAAHPRILRGLDLMSEVGLGYLHLGQTSPTLSGGEAQRLKLVAELASAAARDTLYVLEEPTIGLHMADVERLLQAIQRLVDLGNTVIVIEHNLEIISAADHVVELGPGGGERGGRVVFSGPPQRLARRRAGSPTAPFLRGFFPGDSGT